MHRRHFIRNTGVLATAGLLMQKQALAQIFNVPEFKITMLRNNVGFYTERGGTIGFLLAPKGIVVIDSQFPDTATNFINEIKKTNTTAFPVFIKHTSSWRSYFRQYFF